MNSGRIFKVLLLIAVFSCSLSYSLILQAMEPDWSVCGYYGNLSEQVHDLSCEDSKEEYLQSFGQQFCIRFMIAGILAENEIGKLGASLNAHSENFNEDLLALQRYIKFRDWIWETMKCLQTEIDSYISESTSLTCSDIKDFGFESHRTCYRQTGFCEIIGFWDDIAIKIVGFGNLPSMLPVAAPLIGMCFDGVR